MIEFLNLWLCSIFIIMGLILILLELFIGVETGFDLVMLGFALLLSGALTYSFETCIPGIICVCVLCTVYIVFGRKYVKAKMKINATRTNIDIIIGKTGIVKKRIDKNTGGIAKIGNEEWRAVSKEHIDIQEGENVSVVGIKGVTIIVKK